MCAIAGLLRFTGDTVADGEQAMQQMLATVRHRGPDEFGIYLNDRVVLGNARLSIIDLSGGQQPISNEDQTLWIVFNGEIFNHLELRANLESRGHIFRTACDTEVIVHLYEEFGADSLRQLNGQFAIAIWDERDQSLFLARDRVGVRPLFYSQQASQFIFASEIKSILAVSDRAAELDPVAISQVFTCWSVLPPRTCFRGISELPPGHFLHIRNGCVNIERYWDIDFSSSASHSTAQSDDSLAGELEALLLDATRLRLRADVPVGAYLSGGLDSSLIAAMVKHLGIGRLATFSIAFDDPQFDESSFQRDMAAFLGTDHQVLHATHADVGRVFPDVIWHTETPLLRTAPVPMFLLSRLVHDRNHKVVLTGEGADEFFAGYDIFKETMVRRFWARQPNSTRRPALLKHLYPEISTLSSGSPAFLSAFFGFGLTSTEDPAYSHAIRWRNTARTHRFFSDAFISTVEANRRASAEIRYPDGFNSWTALQKAQYLEITTFLSSYLLSSQGDRVAMAHSVEGRYPFLDSRVMNFCTRLPDRLKLQGLRDKILLRKVASKYLPPDIAHRRKRPYRAPIHRAFLNAHTEPYVYELLSRPALATTGIFNPDSVHQLLAKVNANKPISETDDMALVGIISTQLLHNQFIDHPRHRLTLSPHDRIKRINRTPSLRPSSPTRFNDSTIQRCNDSTTHQLCENVVVLPNSPTTSDLCPSLLETSAVQFPNRPALWHNGIWKTYAELNSHADSVAAFLRNLGIQPGDCVAILLENSFAYVAAHFGALKAGAVELSLNTGLTPECLHEILLDSEASVLIAGRKFVRQWAPALTALPHLRHLILDERLELPHLPATLAVHFSTSSSVGSVASVFNPQPAASDLASIIYTSGSTGRPKGVMLSHSNLTSNARSVVDYLNLTPDDRMMVVLPFHYIYGRSLLYTHLLSGGSLVIDNRFQFPAAVVATMREMRVTCFAGVPSTYSILLNKSDIAAKPVPTLRLLTQAGGAMATSLQKRVVDAFHPAQLFVMYGCTEAAPRLTYIDPAVLPKKWGSIGKPIPGVDVVVLDQNGHRQPPGVEGEIAARGPNIMRGYWKSPEATAEVLRHGYYYTGDLGYEDVEGYLFLTGRARDIMKPGGHRVSSKEVEEAIMQLPGVAEAAVFAVPDDILGEAISAAIVPADPSLTEQAVRAHLQIHLPPPKRPKWIHFHATLPKNSAGKIVISTSEGRADPTIKSTEDVVPPLSPLNGAHPDLRPPSSDLCPARG